MRKPALTALKLVVISGIAACGLLPGAGARADDSVHLSPGRVSFSMKTNGKWTDFGVRGERSLLQRGGVVLFTGRPGSTMLDEQVSAADGDMRALNATERILFEGIPGGARYPSLQPDDDNDGKIDEDPWDRFDNDGDGKTDEDFAAIGDEMAVVIYGTHDHVEATVRQENYAWSLPNVDGMVASTIVVSNTGTRVIPRLHVGIDLEAASDLELGETPVIESSRRTSAADAAFVTRHVIFEDVNRGLAALVFASRSAVGAGTASWELRGDRHNVVVISPNLGDLAPGASVTVQVALVALPGDDLKAARAVRNAHRTVVGDGTSRFVPPPVSVTVPGDAASGLPATTSTEGAGDPFWSLAGKLEEKLLTGSPNPFRDVVTIDYEIPSRVTDEDGVEHALPGPGEWASVKVYNVAGRLVATLVDESHMAGRYQTNWVAQNDDGRAVASGVYYVKLQIGRRSVTMRMVQLK